GNLDDELHRLRLPRLATPVSQSAGRGLGASLPVHRQGLMESAMLTREKPGPARPLLLMRLRGVPAANWARGAFAAMCVLALIGFFVYPTYPTYDSFYALLWGRDLLHLHLPDFSVYRGPTEHPLAIFFGVFCSIFGQYGARLMVLGSIGS